MHVQWLVAHVAVVAASRPDQIRPSDAKLDNPMFCRAHSEDEEVFTTSDGVWDRCFGVFTPKEAAQPMPVMFWFHGSGQNTSAECGRGGFREIARARGFAVVCAEALQLKLKSYEGHWRIPEVQTDATGTKCGRQHSPDIQYMDNVVEMLGQSGKYDTTKVFFAGCSQGAAFSNYIGNCMKQARPSSVSAFATHSTGLKVKGDGLMWPRNLYHPRWKWSECPGCQYFPAVPTAYTDSLGLKACVFDNNEDPLRNDPYFYESSKALAQTWAKLGNKYEEHMALGGHCDNIPFEATVTCLDDGTGRLLRPQAKRRLRHHPLRQHY